MRILIINYFYPPTIDAHAYRWEQIARLWVRQGHQVEVITAKVRGAPNRNIESGVHVTRVGLFAKSTPNVSSPQGGGSLIYQLRGRVLGALRPVYRLVYWPDSMWHWIPSLVYQLARSRWGAYDRVYSYYPCLGAHLGAATLKFFSRAGPFVWIADYGDPFCASPTMQPNNYRLYDRVNQITERHLAAVASHVVFTNEATATAYIHRLGLSNGVTVIPHLANIDDNHSGDVRIPPSADRCVILHYIGGFHRRIREPGRLFDLIRRLNRIGDWKYYLRIYGPKNGFLDAELSPADCPEIMYFGVVERRKALELIRNADVIVNVENDDCIMTPSKVVECISTGRPILNLTNEYTRYDPIQRYGELGHALSLMGNDLSDDTVRKVAQFINSCKDKPAVSLSVIKRVLEVHELEAVAQRYLTLGNSL